MVKAWYMNSNDAEDQRTERHLDPPAYVSLDELKQKTGVLYWQVSAFWLFRFINRIFVGLSLEFFHFSLMRTITNQTPIWLKFVWTVVTPTLINWKYLPTNCPTMKLN